ncbi:hypothetical protein GQ44DRAFT_774943 [Phaeosphaeriaceae sp. PMI808]|nr:hypothetical protein GQ44DRAFT_774943 [Phaeosphaeriaceae sp. PMI808]
MYCTHCAFWATFSLTVSKPTQSIVARARDIFQVEPDLIKRTLYNVDNIPEQFNKGYLKKAQIVAVEITATALKHINDVNHREKLDKWFGDVTVWQEDYFMAGENKDSKPGMHYCETFCTRKTKTDYLFGNCGSIVGHINTDTTTRMLRGANVLHEFMHYPSVGEQQTGKQIGDDGCGAWNCFQQKSKQGVNTALNADTYVLFAMHIWLEETLRVPD